MEKIMLWEKGCNTVQLHSGNEREFFILIECYNLLYLMGTITGRNCAGV